MQTQKTSYKHHRCPPQIIAHVVWFNVSLREVQDPMLERSVDVSYETIRLWTTKFAPLIAHVLRRWPGLDHWSHNGLNNRAENSHLPFRKRAHQCKHSERRVDYNAS